MKFDMWDDFKNSYTKNAAKYFLGFSEKYEERFSHLHPQLVMADIRILLKTWLAVMFFTMALTFIVSFFIVLLIGILLNLHIILFIFFIFVIPILASAFAFIVFYLYPMQRKNKIKKNIETNLPFALTHMSALASSGLSPKHIFEMLVGFSEYGEVSRKAKLIVRNMKVFGMSSSEAIAEVADRVPSMSFRQVLTGIQTTIEKGGNLVEYLSELSERAIMDYKIKRDMYLRTLETYADLYTTILVAAPLMLLVVLGIMGMIGGDVFGFSVEQLMFLITWVLLPVLNVMFLAFLEITYPGL